MGLIDIAPILDAAKLAGKEYVSIDFLKGFEQVDAVPVVRGYSYEDDKTYSGPGTSNYICSVCGEMQGTWKKGLAKNQKFKFCPWCGAKMEDKP